MTNDSSSQFSSSGSRETFGTYANARTLTSSATTTIRLTPNWEVLNDEIPNDAGITNDEIPNDEGMTKSAARKELSGQGIRAFLISPCAMRDSSFVIKYGGERLQRINRHDLPNLRTRHDTFRMTTRPQASYPFLQTETSKANYVSM